MQQYQRAKLNNDKTITFKVITLGELGAGKTQILQKYSSGLFGDFICASITNELRTKTILINGQRILFQMWDTCGQEWFRSINKYYIRQCSVVLLVYDTCSRQSFEKIHKWLSFYQEGTFYLDSPLFAIIGTKIDLISQREVSYQEGKGLADSYGILFQETSCKENINVNELFHQIGIQLLESI